MWLLDFSSVWEDISTEEAAKVIEDNKRYKQVCMTKLNDK